MVLWKEILHMSMNSLEQQQSKRACKCSYFFFCFSIENLKTVLFCSLPWFYWTRKKNFIYKETRKKDTWWEKAKLKRDKASLPRVNRILRSDRLSFCLYYSGSGKSDSISSMGTFLKVTVSRPLKLHDYIRLSAVSYSNLKPKNQQNSRGGRIFSVISRI